MKHFKKFNESRVSSIKDLDALKSGKTIDKEIKGKLYQGLCYLFNKKVDTLINELKSGKKIADMSDDSKLILDEVSHYMRKEHPNQSGGYKSIPQKVKDLWNEDIELDRNILIEYLELSKGSSYWFGSDRSKFPCQRLQE
jgi:hypothetical protein